MSCSSRAIRARSSITVRTRTLSAISSWVASRAATASPRFRSDSPITSAARSKTRGSALARSASAPSSGAPMLMTNGASSGTANRRPRRITSWTVSASMTQKGAIVSGISWTLRRATVISVASNAATVDDQRERASGTTATVARKIARPVPRASPAGFRTSLASTIVASVRRANRATRPVRPERSRRASASSRSRVRSCTTPFWWPRRGAASRRQAIFGLTPESGGRTNLTPER